MRYIKKQNKRKCMYCLSSMNDMKYDALFCSPSCKVKHFHLIRENISKKALNRFIKRVIKRRDKGESYDVC